MVYGANHLNHGLALVYHLGLAILSDNGQSSYRCVVNSHFKFSIMARKAREQSGTGFGLMVKIRLFYLAFLAYFYQIVKIRSFKRAYFY